MAEVTRRIVRKGDKTTAGGTVIAPGANYRVMGRQIANVQCKVYEDVLAKYKELVGTVK